jgi:hypothetical protein
MKALTEIQTARANVARAAIQNRRLKQDERRVLCTVCNEAFIISTYDPFPSKVCNNPCLSAIEIVRDAKNDLAFDFSSTGDGSNYNRALRILKTLKEVA